MRQTQPCSIAHYQEPAGTEPQPVAAEVFGVGDIAVEVVLHLRPEHGEGPIWDAETARMWWVDITAERVHCFDPVSRSNICWPTPGQPGGVVIDADGNPVVAMPNGLAILNPATGSIEQWTKVEFDKPENRTNDAKVDPLGRLWIGTMAFDKRAQNGALYRVDGRQVRRMVTGLTISNGPAFDEKAGRLYLADTALGIVDAFDYEPVTGELANRRLFLDFREAGIWPDGMTVDDEGMLWIALGRAGAVHRYDRHGNLSAVLELPTSNPTSVTFGGSDGGDLYITSSWFDLPVDQRLSQPLAGAIYLCRPGITGPSSPRFQHTRQGGG